MSLFDMYPPAEQERIAELQATSDRVGDVDYEADRIRGGRFDLRRTYP